MSLDLSLTIDDTGLAPFRAAFEAAQASDLTQHSSRLAATARDHNRQLQREHVLPALHGHLDTLAELADFVDDDSWSGDEAVRRAVLGALAYFVDAGDLIPDERPQFGLLDDAIVLELALEHCRHEWQAWREYAEFKRVYPQFADIDRAAWMQLRQDELNYVLRHRRRSAARLASGYRSDPPLRQFEVH